MCLVVAPLKTCVAHVCLEALEGGYRGHGGEHACEEGHIHDVVNGNLVGPNILNDIIDRLDDNLVDLSEELGEVGCPCRQGSATLHGVQPLFFSDCFHFLHVIYRLRDQDTDERFLVHCAKH